MIKNFEYKGYLVEPKEFMDFDIITAEQYGIGKKQIFDILRNGEKFTVCLLIGDDGLVKGEYVANVYELLQGGIKEVIDVVDGKKLMLEKGTYCYNFIFCQTDGWLRI